MEVRGHYFNFSPEKSFQNSKAGTYLLQEEMETDVLWNFIGLSLKTGSAIYSMCERGVLYLVLYALSFLPVW
jgi:hypothetical protein